ncbi:MAG TPA: ABC transporter permease [Anaeromyxobacter sp.]|nr:ABC transporter permease [Anaeromyxobacter sp.]
MREANGILARVRERLGLSGSDAEADRWSRLAAYLPIAGFLVLAAVAMVSSDAFLSATNLGNLQRQIVTNGLISLGMLLVILTGGIDLAVGAVLALGGIVGAVLLNALPWPVAVPLGLLVGIFAGAANGALVAYLRMPPFVATLATMSAFRGLVYVFSETPVVQNNAAFRRIVVASLGPVTTVALLVAACFILVSWFLGRTTAGRTFYAIGGNVEAVRLAGIDVRAHQLLAYLVSGGFAGLAGLVLTTRLGIAQPSVGAAMELDAIAACVIGGASLAGGVGTVRGTLAGVLLLGLINNLLNLYGVQAYWQQIVKGALIVFAVLARQRSD